nr:hypothetical protein GCM10017745_54450 [Saccharothrix mutabilis subsp. capreolus]
MVPPPNFPPACAADTVAVAVANGPCGASTLCFVGAGPRWCGLSAAVAGTATPTSAATASPAAILLMEPTSSYSSEREWGGRAAGAAYRGKTTRRKGNCL